MIAALLAVTLCGASFQLPNGWSARVEELPKVGAWRWKNVRCHIALAPPRWKAVNDASPWSSEYDPADLFLFNSASVDDAMPVVGFMNVKEDGEEWVFTSRGNEPPAEPFHSHGWSGRYGEGWHRGYVDDSKRDRLGDQSGVFSGSHCAVAVKKRGRVAGVQCNDGTPAYHIDCAPLLDRILRTLR